MKPLEKVPTSNFRINWKFSNLPTEIAFESPCDIFQNIQEKSLSTVCLPFLLYALNWRVVFNFRFWMMDPNSLGLMFSWKLSTLSDQAEMAESLRRVNKMEFKRAVGVHSSTMSAEDFRKSVDACWNWLDGSKLI